MPRNQNVDIKRVRLKDLLTSFKRPSILSHPQTTDRKPWNAKSMECFTVWSRHAGHHGAETVFPQWSSHLELCGHFRTQCRKTANPSEGTVHKRPAPVRPTPICGCKRWQKEGTCQSSDFLPSPWVRRNLREKAVHACCLETKPWLYNPPKQNMFRQNPRHCKTG